MQMTIQRNFWKLFLVLFGFSVLFLVLSLKIRYDEIESKMLNELNYAEETLWRGVSLFENYETILDATGYILDSATLTKKEKNGLREFLQRLIRTDSLIIGFGLIDKNGNVVLTNSALDPKKIPNLKNAPQTRKTFLETLKSEHMVIGRPYFFKAKERWILPLRKTIRNERSGSVWVMTLGLDLHKFLEKFPSSKDMHFVSMLVKDKEWFRVFRNQITPREYPLFFGHPIDAKQLKSFTKSLQARGVASIEDLKELKRPITLELLSTYANEMVYTRVRYIEVYHLWSTATLYKKEIIKAFTPILIDYIGTFLIFIVILYLLFKKISELEKKRFDELRYQATHDPLTNLPNRYYMNEAGREWIERSEPFCLLFLDLDNFKNINDTMGHKTGDELLRDVAKRIQQTLPQEAILIRHGGDEFAIFCPTDDIEKIEKVAFNILQSIVKPYKVGRSEFIISGSIGISRYPNDGSTLDELLSASDIAMYKAKELKNSFKHFSSKLIEQQKRAIEIERELRHAIQKEELYLTYQPQISDSQELHGVEALLRWKSEKLGFVSPAEFIPVAEQSGLILEIGKFVIERALREIDTLFKECGTTFKLSINISTKQFAEHNFVPDSYKNLKGVDIDPSLICVEITESLLIDDLDYVLDELKTIKHLGVEISMDDFGTGYSSLHMLQNLPISELKIDKSFIDTLLSDSSSTLMVKTIINLAKIMHMRTVAEGVETKEQLLKLRELGCDIYQGYFFAKPMPKEELSRFIRQKGWENKL